MRYLVLTEWDPSDSNKAMETRMATTVVRETTPRRFPKVLFEAHELLVDMPKLAERSCAFTVWETDDPNQLEDVVAFWKSKMPEMKTFKLYVLPIADLDSLHGKIMEQGRTS